MRTHTKTFHIRFTEKEYERLCKYADKAGLPKTTYIRHMINGCCPHEKPPPEFWQLMKGFHAVGNNLYQLRAMAHKFGSLHAARLEEIAEDYRRLARSIEERMITPLDMDVPAVLERGREAAETEEAEQKREIAECDEIEPEQPKSKPSVWAIKVTPKN